MSNSSPVFSQYQKTGSLDSSNVGILKNNKLESLTFTTNDKYSYNAYRNDVDVSRGIDVDVSSYVLPTFQEIIESPDFNTKTVNATASVNGKLSNTLRSAYQSASSVKDLKSWEMASIVSSITNIDIGFAHDNMDDLIKAFTGRDIDSESFFIGLYKSAFSKVVSSWAGIRARVLNASISGKSEREKQLAIDNFVNNELPQLSYYWNPDMYGYRDSVGGKLLYFMAENAPDIIESFIIGGLTGGIGGKILKLGAKAVNVLDKVIRVASTFEKEAGSATLAMWQTYDANGQRMDYETMSLYSTIIGLVNTGFEFGLEKALSAVGVKTIQNLSSAANLFKQYGKVSSKTILDTGIETVEQYIKKGLTANLKNAAGEGLTEAMQSWSELYFTNLAYKVSDGFGDKVASNKEILSEMAEIFAYTAVSTFLEAPIIGADQDGFSFIGYAKEKNSGRLVKLNQATKYSKQSEGSSLVSMNRVATKGKTNKTTSADSNVEARSINVYKIGSDYVPASSADYEAVNNALGKTNGIFVNVINGKEVDSTQASLDSVENLRSLSIDPSRVEGFTDDTVVVKDGSINSFTSQVIANNDVVSIVTKKDREVVNDGNFNEATIYVKDSNDETVSFNIATEGVAKSKNLVLTEIEDINDKANENIKNEYINRENGIVTERVKESKKVINSEKGVDKVFNESTKKLSKKEKKDVERVRDILLNSLYQKGNDNSFTYKNAKAISSINATLLNLFAKINKTDIKTYVKENLGLDLDNVKDFKPFINLMSETDVNNTGGNPAFIVRNSDGTWTINLYAGVGTGANTQNNLVHEFGHMFVSTIKDESVLNEFKEIYSAQIKEDGGILGEHFQESFSDDLEVYIASGKAKSLEQRNIFELIVGAMTDFFEYIKNINFNDKAEVIQAFDNLFNEESIENRKRASVVETKFSSLKNILSSVLEKIKGKNETIENLVAEINSAIDLIENSSEDTSEIWQELKSNAEQLREELNSNKGLTGDSDISSLIDSLSEENIKELMNNRPIRYNKTVYHGSKAKFKHFKLAENAYKGSGAMIHGWGNYTSIAQNVGEAYAKDGLESSKNTILKTIKTEKNTLEENRQIANSIIEKLKTAEKNGKKNYELRRKLYTVQENIQKGKSIIGINRLSLILITEEFLESTRAHFYKIDNLVLTSDNINANETTVKQRQNNIACFKDILKEIKKGLLSYSKDGATDTNAKIVQEFGYLDIYDSVLPSETNGIYWDYTKASNKEVVSAIESFISDEEKEIEYIQKEIKDLKESKLSQEKELKEDLGDNQFSTILEVLNGKHQPENEIEPDKAYLYKVEAPDDFYLDLDKSKKEIFGFTLNKDNELEFATEEGRQKFTAIAELIAERFSFLDKKTVDGIINTALVDNNSAYGSANGIYFTIVEALEFYEHLDHKNAMRETSALLKEAGYNGNTYLDPGFAEQNYVIYKDEDAQILDRREYSGEPIDFSKPTTYKKNVDTAYTYSRGLLVPYTPQQIVGRIKQGLPVEASHLQTLLETYKNDKDFSEKYKKAIERELNSIRVLTANPVLNRTILEEYNKLAKVSETVDKEKLYENVKAKMEELDNTFKFGNKKEGIALINRAIAHAGWETTETRNASFLAEYSSKEKINELAKYFSDNGYFTNELRFFPLENLKMLALNLGYGYGKITDKTYEKIRQELADPMFTTALRVASQGNISFEDANNVYHNQSVEINNEEFAQTVMDSTLPEDYRKALKKGAYNDTLLQEMNQYVSDQEAKENEQEAQIADLTQSERDLKKELRDVENQFIMQSISYENALARVNALKEKIETQYKGQTVKMKDYHRNLKRCENALERLHNKNVLLQAKMIKERVVRKMDDEIVLNRKTQDHATGRRMEALYNDLRTYQSVITKALKNGKNIELSVDINDVKKDYSRLVTFLIQKGLISEDGYLIGNINNLSLEDTNQLYDLFRAYKAEAKDVLKRREKEKKDRASYDANEIKKDMTVKNQWKLSDEEEAEISKQADAEVEAWLKSESEKPNAPVHTKEEIDAMRENIRLSAIAERELGNAKREARPANAEYNDTLKESKRKTTNRMFNIPRNVLRKINPTLERIIMGGYDADGNETIGIEQLTNKEEAGIRKRSEGFKNTILNLFGDKLKKGHQEKGLVSKWDMFNIFSSEKSTLKDSDTKIFSKSEDDDGKTYYNMTNAFSKLIEQANEVGDINKANVLENIYKVAVQQDKTGYNSGDEHYSYTLEEKIGIYLMLKQEGYTYALWKGNNISASRMLGIYEEFTNAPVNSEMGRAKQLADYLQKDAESKYPEINPISIKLDNKDMSDIKVMDYFGIFYDLDSSYDGLTISLSDDGQRPSTFTLADGFLHDREGGTKALRLDVLSTWAKQVQRQEHYIAFAEYFDHIRRIMNDDGVYDDIKNQNGLKTAQWVKDFLRTISKSSSSLVGVDETVHGVFKSMRSALAKSALSWNIAPVLSQVSTLTYAISEGIPFSNLFGAMKQVLSHPKQTTEYINSLSEQMKAQKRMDVAIARTNDVDLTTKAGKAKYYLDAFADIGMKPLEAFDTGVKNILWLAKYNQQIEYYNNLKTQNTDEAKSIKTLSEKDSEYISRRAAFDANVFVLDSQQSTLAKNNPTIYSTNNDLARSIVMFSFQSIKQAQWHLNNMSDVEKGKRAITWFRNIVGYSMAIALTCAISGRITKDEDEKWDEWWLKVMREMGGEVLTEVPVIGQLISQYDNGWNSSVSIPLGNVAQQGYNLLSKLTEEEKENGKTRWEKASTALKNLAFEAGAFSGLPEAQIKKLYNAFAERNWLYALGYDWGEWLDDLID